MRVSSERGRWPLVLACAFSCACGGAWPFATQPCVPSSSARPETKEPVVAEPAPQPPLRQLGRALPVSESPPAESDGWDWGALTGRVIVRQSPGSGRAGYVWGVKVETLDGAPVVLQPLPMRTRAVGLRVAAGDYVVTTYRHGCVDACARVIAPVRHCRAEVHVEADGVVDVGESAPDRSCRLLHRKPAPEPQLASIGVRHMSADGGASGWYLRAVAGEARHGGEMAVALAPYVDSLMLWVDAGTYALETHSPGHPERAICRSEIAAEIGDAIEVVHTHGTAGCRPYQTRNPRLSAPRSRRITRADR